MAKSKYEKELEKFFDIEDEDTETEYVLDDWLSIDRFMPENNPGPYDEVGLDTTIRSPEDLKEMMGTEFEHVINHFNKNKDS